ncbi:MAG: cupin domain-containing protein [Planctomycetota bacterium]
MPVIRSSDFRFDAVTDEHARGVEISWPIRAPGDAPNFSMRVVRIAPGGCVGLHEHPFEHEVYAIHGEGTLDDEESSISFTAGDICYVEPGTRHGFTNTGKDVLEFVCVIPRT